MEDHGSSADTLAVMQPLSRTTPTAMVPALVLNLGSYSTPADSARVWKGPPIREPTDRCVPYLAQQHLVRLVLAMALVVAAFESSAAVAFACPAVAVVLPSPAR